MTLDEIELVRQSNGNQAFGNAYCHMPVVVRIDIDQRQVVESIKARVVHRLVFRF